MTGIGSAAIGGDATGVALAAHPPIVNVKLMIST